MWRIGRFAAMVTVFQPPHLLSCCLLPPSGQCCGRHTLCHTDNPAGDVWRTVGPGEWQEDRLHRGTYSSRAFLWVNEFNWGYEVMLRMQALFYSLCKYIKSFSVVRLTRWAGFWSNTKHVCFTFRDSSACWGLIKKQQIINNGECEYLTPKSRSWSLSRSHQGSVGEIL